MIYPSPDWFVGVSGLELCLSNGSWIDEKVMNLYPYDAGTDSGPTYISPDQPTVPKEAIRRIKPNQPNDPRSPFHDPDNKEMKPLARLYLTRQRLYEKNCESQAEENSDKNQDEAQENCDTTKWSEWSECDTACGKGRKMKERTYKSSNSHGCTKELEKFMECEVAGENCIETEQQLGEEEDQQSSDPDCHVSIWTEWAECSKPCGKGVTTRTREYLIKKNEKKCNKKNKMSLRQEKECIGLSCSGDINEEKPIRKVKKILLSM